MAERKHILLAAINAKYIHSNLAVYSLKAYAKKNIRTRLDWRSIRSIRIRMIF